MQARLLTAAVGLPLLIALVGWAPAWVFALVVAALAAIGFYEHAELAARHQAEPSPRLEGAAAAALLALSPAFLPTLLEGHARALIGLGVVALIGLAIVRSSTLSQVLPGVATTVLGLAWVGGGLAYLTSLRTLGPGPVFALVIVVWGADAGGYIGGRIFGRTPMAPRLSPKKTMEGLASGLLVSIGGLLLAARWLDLGAVGGFRLALLGLVVALVSVVGDLAESAFKRGAGVKDSGAVFPGHGGVLDRVDSLLFAAPVMYHGLLWLTRP